jgi:hypothetical protein
MAYGAGHARPRSVPAAQDAAAGWTLYSGNWPKSSRRAMW